MNICVIPARGGSKRIPRKNIKLFCGKPIIAWSIHSAQKSGCFEKVVVSTDDEEIADTALSFGAEVPFLRPKELADDLASTRDVIVSAIDYFEKGGIAFSNVCCLYATAPFVTSEDIRTGLIRLNTLESEGLYIFPITRFEYPHQRAIRVNQIGHRSSMIDPSMFSVRSQDLEPLFHDAGQFYWANKNTWREQERVLCNGCTIEIPSWRAQDIDDNEDWIRAEILFKGARDYYKH